MICFCLRYLFVILIILVKSAIIHFLANWTHECAITKETHLIVISVRVLVVLFTFLSSKVKSNKDVPKYFCIVIRA